MYLECVSFSKFYSHRTNLLFVLLEALQEWALTESLRPRTKSSAWWVWSQRPSCPETEKLEGLHPFIKNLKSYLCKKFNQQSDVNSWEQHKIRGKKDCEAKSRLIYQMPNRWPSPPLWLTDHDSLGALHFPAICACKTNQTLTSQCTGNCTHFLPFNQSGGPTRLSYI